MSRPTLSSIPKPVVSFPTVGRQSESVPVGEEVVVFLLRPCGVRTKLVVLAGRGLIFLSVPLKFRAQNGFCCLEFIGIFTLRFVSSRHLSVHRFLHSWVRNSFV
jgi:hypothetical protein